MTETKTPSGEMSFIKGLATTVTSNGHAGQENRAQLTGSVIEQASVQTNPDFRDKKLDGLSDSVSNESYGGDVDGREVTKRRQDKICEAIAIMRMAASESTWLKIRRDKFTEEDVKPGSKTREEIIATVCETVLGKTIASMDFQELYGPSFVGRDGDASYDQHQQTDMSAERRILLIKATEQFLTYAQEHPTDATAQERASLALAAIDRVAAGKLYQNLDKGHAQQARTEAASILASRDILKHRPALEAYFGEKSISIADKLQVVMDLELKSIGQTKELARMIKKLTENGIAPKLQLALVSKIEEGLDTTMTDEDVWATRRFDERRNREDFLKQETPNAREKIFKDISYNLLGAKYTSEQAATQALLVMSRAFPNKPAFALAEDTNDNRYDEIRGSNLADFSPAVIKAIPAFLLKPQSLSAFDKSLETGFTANLIALGFEPKRRMDQDQVKLALLLVSQGYTKLVLDGAFRLEPEKIATYLEMVVALNQKLPKEQRISLFGDIHQLLGDMGIRAFEPKIGNRIMNAGRKLVS